MAFKIRQTGYENIQSKIIHFIILRINIQFTWFCHRKRSKRNFCFYLLWTVLNFEKNILHPLSARMSMVTNIFVIMLKIKFSKQLISRLTSTFSQYKFDHMTFLCVKNKRICLRVVPEIVKKKKKKFNLSEILIH